jgi:hypothetical protein
MCVLQIQQNVNENWQRPFFAMYSKQYKQIGVRRTDHSFVSLRLWYDTWFGDKIDN